MSEKKTRIVTVGGVETKSGESGDPPRKWRRYGLKDADDRFVGSTFSSSVGKFLQEHEGQRIEVDIEEKEGRDGGTLRDLLDAREPGTGSPSAPADGSVVTALNRIAAALERWNASQPDGFDPDKVPQ